MFATSHTIHKIIACTPSEPLTIFPKGKPKDQGYFSSGSNSSSLSSSPATQPEKTPGLEAYSGLLVRSSEIFSKTGLGPPTAFDRMFITYP